MSIVSAHSLLEFPDLGFKKRIGSDQKELTLIINVLTFFWDLLEDFQEQEKWDNLFVKDVTGQWERKWLKQKLERKGDEYFWFLDTRNGQKEELEGEKKRDFRAFHSRYLSIDQTKRNQKSYSKKKRLGSRFEHILKDPVQFPIS